MAAPLSNDGFPAVRGFWPGADHNGSGGLAVGDRLLNVAGVDLRGVGPFEFVARVYAATATQNDLRVSVAYDRNGLGGSTHIDLVPVAFPWRMLPLSAALVLAGALVLVRRPGTRAGRTFFLLTVAYGLHWLFFFGGPRTQTYAWLVVFFCTSLVMLPLILRAALTFPIEIAPADGRLPWWPWLFAVFGPISLSWMYGVPLPPELGFRTVFAVNVIFIVTLLGVLTRNFRRASPIGRRQLKWVVLGIYVGTVPVLLSDVAAAIVPSLWWLHGPAMIAAIVIPLSLLIAIARTNFLDVDRLITGAAVYSVLSVLLLATVLAAVPQVAPAASQAVDLDPHTMQLVLSVLVAAAMVPAQRALRPRVERLLFSERHALRAGVLDLLRDLASTTGPEELLTLVGERLDALVHPQVCVIYAPFGNSFEAVFQRSIEECDAPPRLLADAAVLHALRTRSTPLEVTPWIRAREQPLDQDEHAALVHLRAAVLMPVRRGVGLAAVICLGAKRSGDFYTATDLALLAAVAHKVSSELWRFDTDVILRHEREMSEAFRRYVPQKVVERLQSGRAIEGGQRDVSVLFVDVRDYTAYSELRAVSTVFSMINRYTEAVSAVIQRRGGTVVEFLGDGIMAVFGAPDSLQDHARVSVQAACEVVATVRDLELNPSDGGQPFAVGVGIASGEAFVGNIRAGDRLVYTAVGDVVNLASRIQGLTRKLQAAIAIDARTHRRAGDSAARFERHRRMQIRGRAEPVDVYSLPVGAA